jgi:hypothetical protein
VFVIADVFIRSFNDNRAKQKAKLKIKFIPASVRRWDDYHGGGGIHHRRGSG